MATKFRISKTAKLVEELGSITEQISELQARANELKGRLKEEGEGRIEGVNFYAMVSETTRSSLSKARVKKLLTPLQYKKCLVKTDVTSIRVYRDGVEI